MNSNNVKYLAILILGVCGSCLFLYLGINGFYLHFPQIENLIPEEDEDILLVLFGLGTVVLMLVIYYLDMWYYAQQQFLQNVKGHSLINEYSCIILQKERQVNELIKQLDNLKVEEENAKRKILESSLKEQTELIGKYNDKIKELMSSIEILNKQKEELENRKQNINIEPNFSKKCLAKLQRTDAFLTLRTRIKNSQKCERHLMIQLEAEIDSLFPGFTKSLYEFSPKMNEKQLELCLLLKANFKTTEIASLLCLHYSSISHMKRRIFESMQVQGVTSLNELIEKL